MSRRTFLRLMGVLAGAGGAVSLGVMRLINSHRPLELDASAPTGRLSEQDMQTMLALLEVLVPRTLWPGREVMAVMVHQATGNVKGVLKEYQAGLSLLDQSASKYSTSLRFADAGIEERQRILESMLWRYPGAKPGTLLYYKAKLYRNLEKFFQFESQRRFRELVVRDLLSRFYSGSTAWKMVGYRRYPGLPGNPREYVRPLELHNK